MGIDICFCEGIPKNTVSMQVQNQECELKCTWSYLNAAGRNTQALGYNTMEICFSVLERELMQQGFSQGLSANLVVLKCV